MAKLSLKEMLKKTLETDHKAAFVTSYMIKVLNQETRMSEMCLQKNYFQNYLSSLQKF